VAVVPRLLEQVTFVIWTFLDGTPAVAAIALATSTLTAGVTELQLGTPIPTVFDT
jgi:hypothetical protein